MIVTILCLTISSSYGQKKDTTSSSSDKSTTISALCTAQEEVIQEILAELYSNTDKIDVIKEYEKRMKPKIAECLKLDMIETGVKVQENALNGKFKKIKLSFEKPSDNKFKISGKAKRQYKRAYQAFKKDFVNARKSKSYDDVLGEKNLVKKVDKVAKLLTKSFAKNIRTISK
ncbi:MAG: hypothetical protein WCP92_04865 [bacterium]